MTLTDKHYEIIGWLGFILIVSAYFFLTFKTLDIDSNIYHGMNLAGATFMAINARQKKSRPLFSLNFVWALIALFGLIQIF